MFKDVVYTLSLHVTDGRQLQNNMLSYEQVVSTWSTKQSNEMIFVRIIFTHINTHVNNRVLRLTRNYSYLIFVFSYGSFLVIIFFMEHGLSVEFLACTLQSGMTSNCALIIYLINLVLG